MARYSPAESGTPRSGAAPRLNVRPLHEENPHSDYAQPRMIECETHGPSAVRRWRKGGSLNYGPWMHGDLQVRDGECPHCVRVRIDDAKRRDSEPTRFWQDSESEGVF